MSNGSLRITLRRSPIGYEKSQRRTAVALGLRKLHASVIQPDNPQIRGMIHKINHLLEVEPVTVDSTEGNDVKASPAEGSAPAEEPKKPARRRTAKAASEAVASEEVSE